MVTLILVILASIFDGICDSNMNMFETSIFSDATRFNQQFWNPTISWTNKFKNGDRTQGPKFFGSTTFLVFITDGWHLSKFFLLCCLFGSIVFYTPITEQFFDWDKMLTLMIDFIILNSIWGIFFQITEYLTQKH